MSRSWEVLLSAEEVLQACSSCTKSLVPPQTQGELNPQNTSKSLHYQSFMILEVRIYQRWPILPGKLPVKWVLRRQVWTGAAYRDTALPNRCRTMRSNLEWVRIDRTVKTIWLNESDPQVYTMSPASDEKSCVP
jgi:hypothetical protein